MTTTRLGIREETTVAFIRFASRGLGTRCRTVVDCDSYSFAASYEEGATPLCVTTGA